MTRKERLVTKLTDWGVTFFFGAMVLAFFGLLSLAMDFLNEPLFIDGQIFKILERRGSTFFSISFFFFSVLLLFCLGYLVFLVIKIVKAKRLYQDWLETIPKVPSRLYEPPSDLEPALVKTVIYRGYLGEQDFLASLFDLVNRRVLVIKDQSFHLGNGNLANLKEFDLHLLDFLIYQIGLGNEKVSFAQIQNFAETNTKAYEKGIVRWKSKVSSERFRLDRLEKDNQFVFSLHSAHLIGAFVSSLYLFFALIKFSFLNHLLLKILLFLGLFYLVVFIYQEISRLSNKRSKNQEYAYRQWEAFRHTLDSLDVMTEKEVADLQLWDRWLIYAMILDETDKIRKNLYQILPNMDNIGKQKIAQEKLNQYEAIQQNVGPSFKSINQKNPFRNLLEKLRKK